MARKRVIGKKSGRKERKKIAKDLNKLKEEGSILNWKWNKKER